MHFQFLIRILISLIVTVSSYWKNRLHYNRGQHYSKYSFSFFPTDGALNFDLKSDQLEYSLITPNIGKFDCVTAVILAGYAFDLYNRPRIGKSSIGADGTAVTFLSTEYLKQTFKGALLITLERGKLLDEVKEGELIERLISGEFPDPYAEITINESKLHSSSASYTERILEVFRSMAKVNTREPIWKENNVFYFINNPENAVLNVTIYDKDYLKSDDVIGTGVWNISEHLIIPRKFRRSSPSALRTTIPIYIDVQDGIRSFLSGRQILNKHNVGFVDINAEYIPFESDNPLPQLVGDRASLKEEGSDRHLPRGASPALLNWQHLLSEIDNGHELGKSLHSAGLQQVSFVENAETDTEAYLWADFSEKKIVVAFRGTEIGKLGDVLTDLSVFQTPFLEQCSEFAGAQVHQGFLKAFRSVQDAILQQLQFIFKAGARKFGEFPSERKWAIYITGHSLGGALALLLSADLGRIQNGITASQNASTVDVANNYLLNDVFRENLKSAAISCYTYGTPRVGNTQFKEIFNALVPNCFRVVHKMDIVARMPRSARASIVVDYEHVGKTILIDEESEKEVLSLTESIEGDCPLGDISPLNTQELKEKLDSILEPVSTVAMMPTSVAVTAMYNALKQQVESAVREVSQSVDGEKFPLALNKIMSLDLNSFTGLNNTSLSYDALKEKIDSLVAISQSVANGNNFPSSLNDLLPFTLDSEGFSGWPNVSLPFNTSEFVEQELRLWASIRDGSAFDRHLEPSYYFSLKRALNSTIIS